MTTTTRRAVVAGLAAAPVAAIPAVALPGAPDPIFAAIERHRRATLEYFAAGKIQVVMHDSDPDHARAKAATMAAYDAQDDAAWALAGDGGTLMEPRQAFTPTTLAGALALIDYIEDFNIGGVALNDDWSSTAEQWPQVFSASEEGEEISFAWHLLNNVRRALEALAVQS